MINSPWIKTEVATKTTAFMSSDGEGMTKEASGNGLTGSEKTGDEEEVTAGQSFVRTRAQKRKLSFKENRAIEVSLSHVTSSRHIHNLFVIIAFTLDNALTT